MQAEVYIIIVTDSFIQKKSTAELQNKNKNGAVLADIRALIAHSPLYPSASFLVLATIGTFAVFQGSLDHSLTALTWINPPILHKIPNSWSQVLGYFQGKDLVPREKLL